MSFSDSICYSKISQQKKVATLERRLKRNTNNGNIRAQLIRYYMCKDQDKLNIHRLWFVEHHPSSPFISHFLMIGHNWPTLEEYQNVRAIFCRSLEQYPCNTQLLINAADFFRELEPEIAEDLLQRVVKLRLSSAQSNLDLAEFYYVESEALEEAIGKEYAKKSIFFYSSAFEKMRASGRFINSSHLCRAALMAMYAGEFEIAISYTDEILSEDKDVSSADVKAKQSVIKILRAKILLRMGNIEEAKDIFFEMIAYDSRQRSGIHRLAQDFLDRSILDPVIMFLKYRAENFEEEKDYSIRWLNDLKHSRMVQMCGYDGRMNIRRAGTLWAFGMKDEARKYYQICKEIDFRADNICCVANLAYLIEGTAEAIKLLENAYRKDHEVVEDELLNYSGFKKIKHLLSIVIENIDGVPIDAIKS